jgi:acyl-CoA thioester hydrolase
MARFVTRCAMRWSDMDAYGHVNNTAYLTYLEQARVSMFFDEHEGRPPILAAGMVVSHNEISYLRPIVYQPTPLRLELWVSDLRGASFRVRYELYDGPTLSARASTELVTFDFERDRPRRLTVGERDWLAGFADTPSRPESADHASLAEAPERDEQAEQAEQAGWPR